MSDAPTLAESIQIAKEASSFDDLYRRATASVGSYYMGIYVVTTRTGGIYYFLPFQETKSKSWKGLLVVHYPEKRHPNKATIVHRPLIHGRIDGAKVHPTQVPAAVLERFAEASSKL